MTKLRLVPRDDEAEALYWLAWAQRVLSPDPVERAAVLTLPRKPALTAIPAAADDERH